MAKKNYKRKYAKYRRKYKRASAYSRRKYSSKYRRSSKKHYKKSGVLLPMPNKFYSIQISNSEAKQLRGIYKRLSKKANGDERVPKKEYKKSEQRFMITAVVQGLTTKLYNMKNRDYLNQAKAAMDDVGMGPDRTAAAGDEPHPDPTAAPTVSGTTAFQGARDRVINAAGEVAAEGVRQAGVAAVQAGVSYMTGGYSSGLGQSTPGGEITPLFGSGV